MKTDTNKKYFVTKPTLLYCKKSLINSLYSFHKDNTYTVNFYTTTETDDIYFVINNEDKPLIFAKSSYYNTKNLNEYFVNIKEERKEKLLKINQTR